MNAAQYDLVIDRAAEYNFTLTLKNRSGAVVNLTGKTFYGAIIENATSKNVASFTATVTAPASGEVILALTELQTLALNHNTDYSWDLFVVTGTPPSQSTERLLFGSVTVRKNFKKGIPIDPIS